MRRRQVLGAENKVIPVKAAPKKKEVKLLPGQKMCPNCKGAFKEPGYRMHMKKCGGPR